MRKVAVDAKGRQWRLYLRRLLMVLCISVVTRGSSQDGDDTAPISRATNATPVWLDQLPPPPKGLADLIDAGRVTFVVGGRRPSDFKVVPENTTSTERDGRDSGRRGRGRGRWGTRLSFDAETNFEVHLDYRSRCRWRIRWKDDKRHLILSIRFSDLEVEPTHKIWLKHPIPADQFWDSPLVRHELDHVKLSVMVANRENFANDLREHATVDLVIDDDADVNQAMVLPLVDQHVKARFAELLDLIEIRYQELDRQTRHGTRPVDRKSELFPMLRDSLDAPPDESKTGVGDAEDTGVGAGEVN